MLPEFGILFGYIVLQQSRQLVYHLRLSRRIRFRDNHVNHNHVDFDHVNLNHIDLDNLGHDNLGHDHSILL